MRIFQKIFLLFFSIIVSTFPLLAQEDDMVPFTLKGIVKHEGKTLDGVNIIVYKDGKQVVAPATTTGNGSFSFEFKQTTTKKNEHYTVDFIKKGFVTKTLDVNPYLPEEDYDGTNHQLKLSVTMLKTNYSHIKIERPYAKVIWLKEAATFDLDPTYTQSIQKEEMALRKDPDTYLQNYAKNKNSNIVAGNDAAAKEKELKQKYDAAIAKADAAFNAKKYDEAKSAYNEALGFKPSEAHPKSRISEIDKIHGDVAAAKELETNYKNAISKADADYKAKNYTAAKVLYNEALKLKPNEKHPKDRITLIDRELALTSEKDKAAKYNAAMQKGNTAFNNKDYELALISYKEAAIHKPNDKPAKDNIIKVEKLLDVAKNIEKKYKAFINTADAAFKNKNYKGAKEVYKEALSVKPDEEYPKTKIAEADKLIEAAEKAAIAAANQKNNTQNNVKSNEPNNIATDTPQNNTEEIETNKLTEAERIEIKTPSFDGTQVFSQSKERQRVQQEKRKFEKKKAENLTLKYETNNMSTSLLNAVDIYDKKNKR